MTRGYPATLAAKQHTGTIPIVMAGSGDPAAGSGVLVSLAGPGGNVTGLSTSAPPELGGKRLQLLRDVVPGLSRVGVLWASGDLHPLLTMRETEKVARAMGIQLASLELRRPENLAQAFEAALLGRPIDALIAVEDYITVAHRTEIVDFVATSKLPAVYGLRDFVDAGASSRMEPTAGICFVAPPATWTGFQRNEAWRFARRAAYEVRAGHQHDDGQSSGPHDPGLRARARGPGHPVAR